jgi:hypothetical protein
MKGKRYLLVLIIMAVGCRKPYNPPAITAPNSYLVVEGVISSGTDSTTIKLSRTVNISNKITTNLVPGAILAVESDQNSIYPLTETSNGNYVSAGLNLDISRQYRLRIKTFDEMYLSDFVPVKISPPIDSVYFTIKNNGLTINSDTHDPRNNTRYYRWDYQETWMIHSNFDSFFISNGDTVLVRDLATNQIYTCWQTDTVNAIILNSSAKLSRDVIANNQVTFIASTSEKIADGYSILVRQFALTADAYIFWKNLKKNSEQLGSIFDAQPSQINGNIHSLTIPSEPVIGYISVGTTTTKRLFIQNRQLPAWLPTKTYGDCLAIPCLYAYYAPGSKTPVNQVNEFINYNKGAINPLIPIDIIKPPGAPEPIGYVAAEPICVDCTLRGTNIKPSYWQY